MAAVRALLCFFFLSAALLAGHSAAERTEEEVRQMYDEWRAQHRKISGGLGEESRRFEIFWDNLRYIDEHNRPENNHSYTLGLTRFADLTNEEYRSLYLGVKPPQARHRKLSDRYQVANGDELPDEVDWREKGAVPPIKDQGGCGTSLYLSSPLPGLTVLSPFSLSSAWSERSRNSAAAPPLTLN